VTITSQIEKIQHKTGVVAEVDFIDLDYTSWEQSE